MNWKIPLSACSLSALFLAMACSGRAREPQKHTQFKISGPIVEKLPDDLAVTIWPLARDGEHPEHKGKTPIEVPWKRLVRFEKEKAVTAAVFVDFCNGKDERLMAVFLGDGLFDKPRPIDITLKRPKTFVRPDYVFGIFGFRYHALISKRMRYSALPRWDAKQEKFLPPSLPVLHVYKAANNELVQKTEMDTMCFGDGWALFADFPAELADKTKLKVVVTHDTGDLFGKLKAECSFTYKKDAHGGQ